MNIFTPEFQEHIKKPARSRSNCLWNDKPKNEPQVLSSNGL